MGIRGVGSKEFRDEVIRRSPDAVALQSTK
jgi:hypothetical protein